jgi:putative component of membrane protein insertase Oxa1/YidC/SpoIIIJ protein YidD
MPQMKTNRRKNTFAWLLIAFSCLLPVACVTVRTVGNPGTTEPPSEGIIASIYRNRLDHLSAVRSGECPMHPSCSEYSIRSIEKHGYALGWIMTKDRLMRCGRNETTLAPKVVINGKTKYFDPVERNDSWWSRK